MDNCGLPDGCRNMDFRETHISWVVMTEHYAFKIKRPVRYSFLDFSSPEKREIYCRLELKLNRRLAPEMYLDVIPITGHMVDPNVHNGENVIDHAVKMKRMDNNREMDMMLKNKAVGKSDIEKLAVRIARFHSNAQVVKNAFDTLGFQEEYADIMKQEDFVSEALGEEWAGKIKQCVNKSRDYLNAGRSFFNERIISGFRKDCHGDLNARNIFLYDDPVIFDCIEFNKDFRQIDVLNDIAFLCVDLDFFGAEELSEFFYKKYLEAGGMEDEDETRRLFVYYKSYRANVRAKVTMISAAQQKKGPKRKQLAGIRKYIGLMAGYSESF